MPFSDYDVLKKRNIPIIGIIFNNLIKNQKKIILDDNVNIISKLSGIKTLGIIPYLNLDMEKMKSHNKIQKLFDPIGEMVLDIMNDL